MALNGFFSPGSVAVIGASKDPTKAGYVVFKNLLNSFKGRVYGVNPNADKIMRQDIYPSVLKIKERIETAVIAVPADIVLDAVKQCGKKGVKNLIIISSGFSESGNAKLENDLLKLIYKYKMRCIGPNTVGIFDAHNNFDTMFIDNRKLDRPKPGKISFVSQSGALGVAVIDMAAEKGFTFSKFVSLGNSIDVDASDILEELNNDEKTEIICLYLEGLKDGKKFIKTVSKISKPIIALKGGVTGEGLKAIKHHTGSVAESSEIYREIFSQLKIIQVNSLEEMLDTIRLFMTLKNPEGDKVQIITNGGGYGILAVDSASQNGLHLSQLSEKTEKKLAKIFPPNVIISNPIDLIGDCDAERYKIALDMCARDKDVDIILAIVLTQVSNMKSDIADVLIEAAKYKPMIVVSTDRGSLSSRLEKNSIPVFRYPESAVRALRNFLTFYSHK